MPLIASDPEREDCQMIRMLNLSGILTQIICAMHNMSTSQWPSSLSWHLPKRQACHETLITQKHHSNTYAYQLMYLKWFGYHSTKMLIIRTDEYLEDFSLVWTLLWYWLGRVLSEKQYSRWTTEAFMMSLLWPRTASWIWTWTLTLHFVYTFYTSQELPVGFGDAFATDGCHCGHYQSRMNTCSIRWTWQSWLW